MPRSHTPKRRLVGFRLFLGLLAGLLLWPGTAARADWLFSYPPSLITLDSGKRDNVFYEGDPVTFTLSIANYGTYAMTGTVSYEVRDYFGAVVDRGTAVAPTPTTAPPTLTLRVAQPGWYKLYVHGASALAPWGDSVGGTMFCIFRQTPGFPAMPPPTLPGNDGGADGGDEVTRGVTGMGPIRHEVKNAGAPAQDIATLQQAIALDTQFYTPYDPQRPRPLLIAFPNGVGSADAATQAANLAGLTQVVRQFHTQVKYWEPLNEPNNQYGGADYVAKELIPFYRAVKAVDPSCKVLGPAIVTIGPYGLRWVEDFLKAGGANYIDAFSFHAYNNLNGDLTLGRESLDALQALLAKYGAGGIEKWQTEQGYFAACYGAYEPRLQGRWTMLQMMLYEQYGIPKEHNHLWYDKSHGFWSFPAFWENEDGPYSFGSLDPAAPLMRVWSEELYGTNFSRAYGFGALGDKMYLGDLFTGPGKQVAAFVSAGRTDGRVTLTVAGGASLHVVSAFGVAQDLPVSGGQVVLPVPELPVYVEPAPGQTIAVVPTDFGPDLALTPGTTATASGTGRSPLNPAYPNDIGKVINGALENWYWAQGPGDHPWMDDTPAFPAWVQITLPRPMPVSHVVVYAGVPWQSDGSLLDYELQYDRNGQWVTVDHVQEPATVVSFFTPTVFSTVDSFYSDRCLFESDFPAVTTQKVRLLVHDTTYGGAATAAVVAAGGQPGPHQVELREVELYGDGQAGGTAPAPAPAPAPSGQVRYIPRTTCASRMVGGQFQGSADGVNYATLSTVTAIPQEGVWTAAPLAVDPRQYRYLRYLAPDGAYGNIAELEFDSGSGAAAVKITGTPFGTPGSYYNAGNDLTKVFDGDPTTFFDAPAPGNGDFVGIDQGGPPPPAPAAPAGLTATAGDGSVALAWGAVPGATSYTLSRSTASGQETRLAGGLTTPADTDTGLTDGTTYFYVVTAVGPGGEGARSNEAGATPTAPAPAAPVAPVQALRINAGGPSVGAFLADQDFTGGGGDYATGAAVDTGAVAGPAPQAAYQTEHWGQFTYALPGLTPGAHYTVRLHFAEIWFGPGMPGGGGAGSRLFSVVVNGQAALTDFDIFAAAGGANRAVVEEFPATADAAGRVTVQFVAVRDNPKLSAIEAVAAAPTGSGGGGGTTTASGGGTAPTGGGTPINTGGGATTTAPTVPAPTIPAPGPAPSLRINAGGGAVGAFLADRDFTGGGGDYATGAAVDTGAVAGPAPQAAYQTEHWGQFTYALPGLTPGAHYTVRLHFAEIYWNGPGRRLFNVAVNGQAALTDFDIFAAAGGMNRAVVEEFPATADAAGRVTVQFVAVRDNPKLSAIEAVAAP